MFDEQTLLARIFDEATTPAEREIAVRALKRLTGLDRAGLAARYAGHQDDAPHAKKTTEPPRAEADPEPETETDPKPEPRPTVVVGASQRSKMTLSRHAGTIGALSCGRGVK